MPESKSPHSYCHWRQARLFDTQTTVRRKSRREVRFQVDDSQLRPTSHKANDNWLRLLFHWANGALQSIRPDIGYLKL
jgi:hypothetical protein